MKTIILSIVLLFTLPVFALDLTDMTTTVTLQPEDMMVLEDPSSELSPADAFNSKAYYTPTQQASIEDFKTTYWVKFSLSHNDRAELIFENLDLHIEHFTLFKIDEKGTPQSLGKTGFYHDANTRSFPHKNLVYHLTLDQKPTTYLVKLKSTHNHNPFIFKISAFEEFSSYSNAEYYLLGAFYGILIIMGIYNLLLYFNLKDSIYLSYVGYIIICILISLVEDGIGFQYVWPTAPFINTFLWEYRSLLFLGAVIWYSSLFLELHVREPKIRNIIKWSGLGYTVAYLLALFFLHDENIGLIIRTGLFPIPFLVILYGAIKVYKAGFVHARFFIIGFAFIILGQAFQLLRESGILYLSNVFFVYSFYIGLIIESLAFSYALGHRFKVIRQEKDAAQLKIIEQLRENELLSQKVNRELEQKVKERTEQLDGKVVELNSANAQLEEQAEEINHMNSLLDYDNWKLKKDLEKMSKARVIDQFVDYDEFTKIFSDDDHCLKFLSEKKWDKGFKCKKMQSHEFL